MSRNADSQEDKMKRLLSAIWLKIIAVMLAALSLTAAFAIFIVVIENYEWFRDEDLSWYSSSQMRAYNNNYLGQIEDAFELAREMEADGIDVPEADTSSITVSSSDRYDYYFHEGMSQSEKQLAMHREYNEYMSSLKLQLQYFVITDGETVFFHSANLDPTTLDGKLSPDVIRADFAKQSESDVPPIYVDLKGRRIGVHDELYSLDIYRFNNYADTNMFIVYLPLTTEGGIDGFGGEQLFYDFIAEHRDETIWSFAILTVTTILLMAYACSGAGYRRRPDGSLPQRGEITLSWLDRIPLEILAIAFSVIVAMGIMALESLIRMNHGVYVSSTSYNYRIMSGSVTGSLVNIDNNNGVFRITFEGWLSVFSVWGLIVSAFTGLLSLIRRAKARQFWRHSIVGWIGRSIRGSWRWFWSRVSDRPRMILILALYYFACFIFIIFLGSINHMGGGYVLFTLALGAGLFVVLPLAVFGHLMYVDRGTRQLTVFSNQLTAGEEPQALIAAKLHPNFRPLYSNLEQLDEGLQLAVSRQLQADRLKTDLITNVSHDLKTPLTSIINYIDLLKREGLDGPDAASYLETLDQKANRLKVLTEDLVEASKASSGNLPVEREWLDLIELMRQVSGEFEDRMSAQHLSLIPRLPADTPRYMIWSDGHHIWRILENLLENAHKYSLQGSRVYLSLQIDQTGYRIQVKNISAIPLDLSTSDLMERFVRGDSSRHTDGSGLGLSITSSLADLLGGRMELDVRDDVFVATVVLPFVNAPEPFEANASFSAKFDSRVDSDYKAFRPDYDLLPELDAVARDVVEGDMTPLTEATDS